MRVDTAPPTATGPAGPPAGRDSSGPTLERGRRVTAGDIARRADWIRLETIRLIDQAGLGHDSSTFSCAEAVGRAGIGAALRSVALPDERLAAGVPAQLDEHYGLTVPSVVAQARALLDLAPGDPR